MRVVVPQGASAAEIGALLEERGIIADAGDFAGYLIDEQQGAAFKAGTYRLRPGTGYRAIVSRLNTGPPASALPRLVVPEGFRITDIEERVRSVGISPRAYRRAVRAARPPRGFAGATSMEGFLFPATYTIEPDTTARSLVGEQLEAFSGAWSQLDLAYARSKNLSNYDVVKIASMIEREARVAEERPLIAAVIYNRLSRGMTLGIDATLLYEQGSWTAELTESVLEANTPYNSRIRHGLPPTPISNPGLSSLKAAARPADVGHLYYVAKGDSGRHFFTDDYDEFLANGGGG